MSELLRILLVEETPERAQQIQDLLTEASGVECLLASGLAEGRQRLQADGPDVVLLSWPMENPAAAEAELREWTQQRPVILLLAEEDPSESARAIRDGAQDCIPRAELTRNLLLRSIQLAMGRHRERERLRSSESRYRLLFERNLTGVYRCTPDGRIVDANRALALMLGFESSEELKQHSAVEFYFDPDERNDAIARLRSLTSVTNAELRLRRRDGSALWVLESMILLDGDLDASRLIEGTLIDITDRKYLEEALAHEQDLLHTLMEHLPDSIYFKDTRSRFIRVSHACARKFGCDHPNDVIGKTDFDFFATAHASDAFADEQETMRNGRGMIAREEKEVWPDGRVAWASTTKMPMHDAQGRIAGTFGVSRDITRVKNDQRRIEHLQRQNELILYSVGDGICGVDQDGRIIFANPTAAQLTGWMSHELIGRSLHDLLHPRGGVGCSGNRCTLQYALQDGGKHQQEEVFTSRDGSSFPVEFISNAMKDNDGQPSGAVLAFRDISERREIERMKDEFVSVVSHELRTPLTSIRGALGLLVSGRLGALPERGQRMLEIASSNTDRLVRLINDILDLERIESGKIRMECDFHDLSTLVQQALDLMRPMAERAGVELRAEGAPLPVWVDADRIQQTLNNLLSNAIKFSPPGAVVAIETSNGEDGVTLRVRDHGRGIPAEHLEKIFDRFHQVDKSDSRDKGGTGLGLPICRRIVEQHGGRIWAESRAGTGSTFHVLLPRTHDLPVPVPVPKKKEEEALPSPPPATEPATPFMLVYSEDPERREMVVRQMMRAGYRVRTANCPEEAVRYSALERPGAILVDVPMSGQNGWGAIVALRDQLPLKDVPILVIGWTPSPASPEPLLPMISLRPSGYRDKPPHAGKSPLAPRSVRRILLVEDDRDLAGVLTVMFQQHQVETIHACSGREAVEAASACLPDLVVLDVGLPEGDGFHVVRGLQQNERLRQVPLVVYSGRNLSAAERLQLRLGPTEFLIKGQIAPEEFERHVLKLLAHLMA